jgi:hypothetical protein
MNARVGTQGWRQFLTAKQQILDAFDRARTYASGHETQTYHGRAVESEVRRWLTEFLPKRYGVTAGYVISQATTDSVRAPHFDVIIYDQLESPILWTEAHPDAAPEGRSRGVPAEHVRAVYEVKSALNFRAAHAALTHLRDLAPLLQDVDAPGDPSPRFLPAAFFCGVVFVELRTADQFDERALSALTPLPPLRGFAGGIVLRGQGLPADYAGQLAVYASDQPISATGGGARESLLGGSYDSNSQVTTGPDGRVQHLGMLISWGAHTFAQFAFDIVALLRGTYEPGRLSSLHGVSWLDPARRDR